LNRSSSAPRRVAFCITELNPGGAERCLVELVTRLDRGRFEPVVYCLGPRPLGNPISLADVLEQANVRVHCFDARGAWSFPRVLLQLRRQLAADRPHLVQSFLFHANVVTAMAARWAGVSHVVTGIRVAERGRGWHLRMARMTDRWIERHVCVSQSVRDFSARQGGLPDQKLVVIPNGVDAARFAAAVRCPLTSLGVDPGRKLLLYVGRLDEQKQLPWLFELLPTIFERLPDHDLLIVGSGPQRALLERMAADRRITQRVHFAGFRFDVAEILAASELLLLPSRWEGMPNVILEAMASGKPVVATAVEGVVELLGAEGASFQSVSPGDAEAFVSKVFAIASNATLAARLGQQNRDRAVQEFSFPSMVAAYERLYLALMEERPER
jgi:glycosyltransferase involved in cell wall biosynthesis